MNNRKYIYPIIKKQDFKYSQYKPNNIKMIQSCKLSEFAKLDKNGYYYGMKSKQGYLFVEENMEDL